MERIKYPPRVFHWGDNKKPLLLGIFFWLTAVGLAGWTGFTIEYRKELKAALSEKENIVTAYTYTVEDILDEPSQTILSLQRELSIRQALDEKNVALLEKELLEMVSRNTLIRQARLIGLDGKEVVRAERINGIATLIPKTDLQDKSAHEYFAQSINLKPGQLYVSELDLNVEFGAVPSSTYPTIRVAGPAVGVTHSSYGIFVVNLDMSQYFNASSRGEFSGLLVTNSRGEWLKAPQGSQAWAFMYGSQSRISDFDQNAWRTIQGANNGVFQSARGYWIWSTVFPLLTDVHRYSVTQPDRYLKAIALLSETEITAVQSRVLRAVLIPLSTVAALLLLSLLALIRAMSMQKTAELKAEHMEELARAMIEVENAKLEATLFINDNVNGIVIVDERGVIQTTNPALNKIFGYDENELIGRRINVLIPMAYHAEHDKKLADFVANDFTSRSMVGRAISGVARNGRIVPLEVSLSPLKSPNAKRVAATVVDLTERFKVRERISQLETYDQLTGLANRYSLYTAIEDAIKQSEILKNQFMLIVLDLDFFKHLNDSLGHEAGDILLVETAKRLEQSNISKRLVARICGDEFVLLIDDVSSVNHSVGVIEQLLDIFKKPFKYSGGDIWLTASAGISVYPQDGSNASDLLRNADSALSQAKSSGRNDYRYYTLELTVHAQRTHRLENDLRFALLNEQLYLTYQPQIDARTEQVVGVECLLRWRHPELGVVSPAEFIPLAEMTGLIVPIGEWVIKKACETAANWLSLGIDFGYLSVNVAGPQVHRGGLAMVIQKYLQLYNVASEFLEVEVTESFVMGETKNSLGELEAIKAVGVALSIDDFGTGYSSLAQLKALPVDKLKLDRSFVDGLPNDQNDVAIAKTIIELGKNLDLQIIAEGVETESQLHFLQQHNCHIIQGYYFSQPLTYEDFLKRYSTGRALSAVERSRLD